MAPNRCLRDRRGLRGWSGVPSVYRHPSFAWPAELFQFVGIERITRGRTVFRIKICGVRLEKDVRAVERSGGDAIGLNFFPRSVRFVDPLDETTRRLSDLAEQLGLLRIGVFVNVTVESIDAIAARVALDAVQLHGDEPVELARQLIDSGHQVIRAIKLPKTAFDAELLHVRSSPWSDLGCHLLLDVDAGAAHGGSGKTLDWPSVARWSQQHPDVSWTLAGGLAPENVAEAIRMTGAQSVDTASGVECPRGVKNEDRIQAFVSAAENASSNSS